MDCYGSIQYKKNQFFTAYFRVMGSRQSHTFLVYLLSDLLLQIPLRIPHLVNYCSLLSSRPPPPFHSVTVDTWHLETTCSSPTKCCTNIGQKYTGLKEPRGCED